MAATRGKGLWQGKGTPLGYGVDFEQRLVVIAHEADLVHDVFRQYLGLDSMTELMELLQRQQAKKIPTDKGWDFEYWWCAGNRRQTTHELLKRAHVGW